MGAAAGAGGSGEECENDGSAEHHIIMRLAIAGGGRAAWAFGSAWRRIGWPIVGVWVRDESKSPIPELLETPRRTLGELADRAELLLIAVSDRAIEEVAQQIPDTNAIIFHA